MDVRVYVHGVSSIFVRGVGLLTAPFRLVVSSVPTSLSSSLPLLVIGGGLIREVVLSVELYLRNMRTCGWNRCRMHRVGSRHVKLEGLESLLYGNYMQVLGSSIHEHEEWV